MTLRLPHALDATEALAQLRLNQTLTAPKAKGPSRVKSKTQHIDVLAFQLRAVGLTGFRKEWLFAKDSMARNWRFDFAFIEQRVGIEVEGLVVKTIIVKGKRTTQVSGRHAGIDGMRNDMRKYNAAADMGWCVLRFEQSMIDSGEALQDIQRAMRRREVHP